MGSSECGPDFLPETIYEILLRLPVKTLGKMRCVSKSWLSQTSNPQFIKNHLKISAYNQEFTHHNLIFIINKKNIHSCSLNAIMHQEYNYNNVPSVIPQVGSREGGNDQQSTPIIPVELNDFAHMEDEPYCSYYILGSCHGLFFISNTFQKTFLWNPTTRGLKVLPLSMSDLPGSSPRVHGFGYNERQDDYRFVIIAPKKDSGNEVYLYSLRSHSWRKILEFPGARFSKFVGQYVNGRLHWVAEGENAGSSKFIFSLDLVGETYEKIALPNFNDKHDWKLETLGGGNYLYVTCKRPHDDRIEVWVMKEYGLAESWTMLASVPPYSTRGSFAPIFIFHNGEILLRDRSRLLVYNSTRDCFTHPKIQGDFRNYQIHAYVESLVSPNSVCGI